jgi:hypothetical protein
MALLHVGYIVGGAWMLANEDWLGRETNTIPGYFREEAMLLVVFGFVFGFANLALPLFPKRAWAYVLHATNIAAAGLTCVLLPCALPLFLAWLKPEVREFFQFR